MDDFPVDLGASSQRGSARCIFHPRPDGIDPCRAGMANIVKNFGEIGNNIGGVAAGRDHIMDATILRHMFAHHVYHHVECFHAVESGTGAIRSAGRMCRLAAEPELG